MYLLDSDTCVDVLRGHQQATQRLANTDPATVFVSAATTFELMWGAVKSNTRAVAVERVDRFLRQVNELLFDHEAAVAAANIRRALSDSRTTIGPYDLLIAGHAVSKEFILVTSNVREFQRVTGLKIESWRT